MADRPVKWVCTDCGQPFRTLSPPTECYTCGSTEFKQPPTSVLIVGADHRSISSQKSIELAREAAGGGEITVRYSGKQSPFDTEHASSGGLDELKNIVGSFDVVIDEATPTGLSWFATTMPVPKTQLDAECREMQQQWLNFLETGLKQGGKFIFPYPDIFVYPPQHKRHTQHVAVASYELELEHVVEPTQKHFSIETLATFLNEAMALNLKSSRFAAEGVLTTRDNRDYVVFMKNIQADAKVVDGMLPLVMSEGARTFANGLSDDLDDQATYVFHDRALRCDNRSRISPSV